LEGSITCPEREVKGAKSRIALINSTQRPVLVVNPPKRAVHL